MATRNSNGDSGDRLMGPKVEPAIAPPLRTVDTRQDPKVKTSSAAVRKQANIVPDFAKASTQEDTSVEETAQVTEDEGYDPDDIGYAEEEIELLTPSDRIAAGTIVYIRNNTRGIVRFVDSPRDAEAKFNLLLKPAGQDDSVVSLENLGVLRNPGFQKWWKAEKLTVSTDSRLAPLPIDISQIEIERLQQFQQNGTLEHAAKGSLPLHKDVDMGFLGMYDKHSPDYKL